MKTFRGIFVVLFCVFSLGKCKDVSDMRYLLYDVNPGEGFNLRRDVYMRMANLVKFLNNKGGKWTLVVPPWGRIYHWHKRNLEKIPWSTFFDLDSLNLHVPVIEFTDYLKVRGEPVIDEVYGLQRYKEGWGGEWKEKLDIRECIQDQGFEKDKEGRWHWWFWGYDQVYAEKFVCVSVQMEFSSLTGFLSQNTTARSVFLWRAEEVHHGLYSNWSPEYWTARRSMRFARHLQEAGDAFRREELDSDDVRDRTVVDADWRDMRRQHGDALGGPYLAVHLRRRDFLYGHSSDVPSIKNAAEQISDILKAQGLKTVFIATDAPQEEYKELASYLSDITVKRYIPSKEVLQKYKAGGVAIIDQWICAHARYFVGTSVSTFSFRIHEEREILGFNQETTYNRLCGDDAAIPCEQSTKWEIQYPKNAHKDEL